MTIEIYHNPRCSKSRKTLELIQESGAQPDIIDYLKVPPSPGKIREILQLLNARPRDILRTNEAEYHNHGLNHPDLDDEELIQAMHAYPILLERPIVVGNGQAIVGRPPERVLGLLKQ